MSNGVDVQHQDRVVIITLDEPPLNILAQWHIEALRDCLAALHGDGNTDVIWLRGNENSAKAFCAGVSVADHARDKAPRMLQAFRDLSQVMLTLPQVIVTEVFGAVLGGGMELVLMSDVVIASDDAQFGQPEILLAATPPVAAALLPQRLGWNEAVRVCLLGDRGDVEWARQRGLVTQVVPRNRLRQAAQEVVRRLLDLSRPAVRTTKRIMRESLGEVRPAVHLGFDLYLSELLPTEDSEEGVAAFLGKRRPVWRHR